MKLLAQCPACSQVLQLGPEAIDQLICCPNCKHFFKTPDEAGLQKAIKKIKGASSSIFVNKKGNTYA